MEKNLKFESLRGIACIIVLVAHWISTSSSYGIYAMGCGKIGVWCFMIMCGFFLMLPYVDDVDHFSVLHFYLKRFLRIYPVYIVSLLLAVISGLIKLDDVLPHILAMKGAGHFWYMPVIIKMYLVYPVFIFLYKFIKNGKVFVGILISVTALSFFYLIRYTDYQENSIRLYWYIPIFAVGMILAFVFKNIRDKKILLGDFLVILGVTGILALTPLFRKILWGFEPSGYLHDKYLLVVALEAIIFLGIMCGKYIGELLGRCRFLQKVGKLVFLYICYII